MKHPKQAIVALTLLLSACAAQPNGGSIGSGIHTPAASQTANGGHPSPGSTRGVPVPGNTGGTPQHTEPAREAPATFTDDGAVGAAAAAYLRPSPWTNLVVEIDYVGGLAPSQTAVDHLTSILHRETGKVPKVVPSQIPGNGGRPWSIAEILAAEQRYRNHHSSGSTVTMWIAYLDGSFGPRADALGVAYESTGAAVFEQQVRDAASPPLVTAAAIEEAAITHEAGHLLGLVNLFAKSKYDHEDPSSPGHSKYKSSVMYYAIESTSIAAILSGGPPNDFDRFDRDDLAAIRGS